MRHLLLASILRGGLFALLTLTSPTVFAATTAATIDSSFLIGTGASDAVNSIAVQGDGKILLGGLLTNYNGHAVSHICRINSDGSYDGTFGVGLTLNFEVNVIVIQPDGKILVGGSFTQVNATSLAGIVRLNSDGSVDNTFLSGAAGVSGAVARYVNDIALQSDGKIVIAGAFTSVNGVPRNNIARLDASGAVDTSFVASPGPNAFSSLNQTKLQPDGKLIVIGSFTNFSGLPAGNLVRLNTDGSRDFSFNPATEPNGTMTAATVQPDGRILLGGSFKDFPGITNGAIVRLNADGSRDNTFAITVGAIYVFQLTVLPDSKILVTGHFTDFNHDFHGSMARLNSDGTTDTAFQTDPVYNDHVYCSAVQSDGKYLLGGLFTNFNSVAQNHITRLNGGFVNGPGKIQFTSPSYQVIESAGTATISVTRFDGVVGAAAVNYAATAGSATAADFTPTTGTLNWAAGEGGTKTFTVSITPDAGAEVDETINLALSSPSGATLGTVSSAVLTIRDDDSVPVITLQPQSASIFASLTATFAVNASSGAQLFYQWRSNGVAIAGATNSSFSLANIQTNFAANYSVVVSNINGSVTSSNATLTVLQPAGSLDNSFTTVGTGFNGTLVNDIAVQSDGKLVLGGNWNTYNSVSRGFLARLNTDGTLDGGLGTNGANFAVYGVALQADAKVLIVGTFSTYNGVPRSRIARINSDGSLDTTWTNSLIFGGTQYGYDVLYQPDGKSIVAMGGNGIYRFTTTGSVDTAWTNISAVSTLTYPWALALQSDGKVLVGGFSSAATNQGRVYRLNSDGTLDATFSTALIFHGTVQAIAVQSDGKVLVGGTITALNNAPCGQVVRLKADGTLDTSFNATVGNPSGDVIKVIAVQSNGQILVGGSFTTFNGATANNLVRLNANGTTDSSAFFIGTGANGTVSSIAFATNGTFYVAGQFTSFNGQPRFGVVRLLGGPGAIQFSAPSLSVVEGTTNFTVNVERVNGGIGAVSVTYTSSNGTAIAGSDYTSVSNVLSWADGELGIKTFTVPILTDAAVEDDETIQLRLTNPTGGAQLGVNSNIFLTILDDESPPRILTQPLSQTVAQDVPVTFFVNALSGVTPLSYQWRSNGVNIAGATSSNLTLAAVQSSFAASYSVVVTNARGSTNSANAVLVVTNSATRLDSSFALPSGFNNFVRAITPLGDGRVLVGGDFTTPANRIVLLNANGTVNSSFTNTISGGAAHGVYRIFLQPDGKILVGGSFTNFAGRAYTNLVRLNADFTVDTNFMAALGFAPNATVRDIALQTDGKIFLAGDFTLVANRPGSAYLARLNDDGSFDSTFVSRASGTVYRIVPLATGKALVGLSTTYQSYNYFLRINADGSRDTTYNPNISGGAVQAISVLPNGQVLIGGDFATCAGISRPRLARLNTDATLDQTFLTAGAIVDNTVYDIAPQENGRIFVAGKFVTFNTAFNRIVRLNADGSIDPTISIGTGLNSDALRLALEPDGRLWVGGQFTTYKTTNTVNYLMRLAGDPVTLAIGQQPMSTAVEGGQTAQFSVLAAGTPVISYQWLKEGVPVSAGNISGANSSALSVNSASQIDAGNYSVVISNASGSRTSVVATLTLLAAPVIQKQPAGGFFPIGGTLNLKVGAIGAATLTYQWRTNGVAIGGATASTYSAVNAQSSQSAAYTVVVANGLGSVTSTVANVTVMALPGSPYTNGFPVSAGPNSRVLALAAVGDGSVFIGGQFIQVGKNTPTETTRNYVALFNADGSVNTNFNPNANNSVNDILIQQDGKIVVVGNFTTISGQTGKPYIARYNADFTYDTNFYAALGSGPNNIVYDVEQQPDGRLLVAGTFTSVSGAAGTAALVRLNQDGSVDTSFQITPAPNVQFYSISLQSDGKVLGCGPGGQIGSMISYVYRLGTNGALDTNFVAVLNNTVRRVVAQPDGRVIVAGDFTTVNSVNREYAARLLSNGAIDSSFLAGVSIGAACQTAALQQNGKILFGGNFAVFGQAYNLLARVNSDGTLDTSFDIGLGFSGNGGTVNSLGVESTGHIWVGGSFLTFNGVTENNLTVLNGDPVVPGVSFNTWKADKGLPVGQDGPGDDPDGDGISNIFEYYFNLNPMAASPGTLPRGGNVVIGNQVYPAIVYTRTKNLSGVTPVLRASSNALFSDSLGTVESSVVDLGTTELVTARSLVSISSVPIQFLRLQLSQ